MWWLIAGVPYENWLLIFDDAENVSYISNRYIPQTRGFRHVIITSRNINWRTLHVDGIELTEFKPEENGGSFSANAFPHLRSLTSKLSPRRSERMPSLWRSADLRMRRS